jgi:integrase
MPDRDSTRRIVVWAQHFADREYLMLQWHDPLTGQRKSKSSGTNNPLEAEKRRADLEYELNHGLFQEADRMSWERFRELFEQEHVEARRQNTKENYQAMFDTFERLCKPTSLRGVTERTISQYAALLRRERGRTRGSTQQPATIRQRLALLRTALGWAVRQKLLPELPDFPTVKVPKKRPQPIPAESFEKLLAKAPDANLRAYLLAGWLGGLRLHEAASLEWEETDKAPWLDLGRDRICFPAGFVKADEDQWVPLDPQLREALEALPRRGKKVFRFVAKNGRPIGESAIGERVMRLAKKAGVKLTMHSLRKGFGCRYAGKVPAQVLQKLMRHSNISLTMAYYANVDDAAMEAVLGPRSNAGRNKPPSGAETLAEDLSQVQDRQDD